MRIGIDLGGTKIEGIVLGPDGAELARERVSTPAGDYRVTLQVVAALVCGDRVLDLFVIIAGRGVGDGGVRCPKKLHVHIAAGV